MFLLQTANRPRYGVGSTLNVKPVDTNPNGTATTGDARPNLVDLVGTDAAPVNKNAAATVGDLQNMGWVVSTEKGNGYKRCREERQPS